MNEAPSPRSRAWIYAWIALLLFSNFVKSCRIDNLNERVKQIESQQK